MKRRDLLTGVFAGGALAAGGVGWWRSRGGAEAEQAFTARELPYDPVAEVLPIRRDKAQLKREAALARLDAELVDRESPLASSPRSAKAAQAANLDAGKILEKVRNYDRDFADDIVLSPADMLLMQAVVKRLAAVQRVVGHGNYNLISFDALLKFAKRFPEVGRFTPPELQFLEQIFFAKASSYGFLGDKVTTELTATIAKRDTYKVPRSGHYVYRGDSRNYYDKLVKDVGEGIILTSGIRSNVKQMHLFLAKAVRAQGNLSRASRSLAPPGHSYHGIGDFDVGRTGWGASNFTDKFARTDEFKRMQDLGYVQIRYTEDNQLGVRFEPWHIKVV